MWEMISRGEGWRLYKAIVRCPDRDPPVPEGWVVADAGGAHPYCYVYDPDSYRVWWVSAGEIRRGEYEDILAELRGRIVADVEASAHGCWKLIKRQRLLLVRRED